MDDEHTPLRDSATFWLGVGGVTATIAALPIAVGFSQHAAESVWENGWFRTGVGMAVLGGGALLFALVLVVAHKHAGREYTRSPAGISRLEHVRVSVRTIRAEIATCQTMIEEASRTGYYPWSSFGHKLPRDVWSASEVVLAVDSDARDAYHFSSMAYGHFNRINRLVTDMAVNQPQVLPEHSLDVAIRPTPPPPNCSDAS